MILSPDKRQQHSSILRKIGKPLQHLSQDREGIPFVEVWQIAKEATIHGSSSHQEVDSISPCFAFRLACYLLWPIACRRDSEPVPSWGLKGSYSCYSWNTAASEQAGLACGRMTDLVKKVPHYLTSEHQTCEQDHPGPASPPPACQLISDVQEGRTNQRTCKLNQQLFWVIEFWLVSYPAIDSWYGWKGCRWGHTGSVWGWVERRILGGWY